MVEVGRSSHPEKGVHWSLGVTGCKIRGPIDTPPPSFLPSKSTLCCILTTSVAHLCSDNPTESIKKREVFYQRHTHTYTHTHTHPHTHARARARTHTQKEGGGRKRRRRKTTSHKMNPASASAVAQKRQVYLEGKKTTRQGLVLPIISTKRLWRGTSLTMVLVQPQISTGKK